MQADSANHFAFLWFTLLGYACGALPFSVWLGNLFLRRDVRAVGEDHNPGAANAWKAGTWRLGFPVLLLDFLKGAVPVALARQWVALDDPRMIAVALAPALGHAFSPFLGFTGGKAITVTFGVWTALTAPIGPFVLGGLFSGLIYLVGRGAWAVMLSLLGFLGYLLVARAPLALLGAWAVLTALLGFKHRVELRHPPRLSARFRPSPR